MNDHELKEEAERLGWTIEYLKINLAKEGRIEKVFDKLKDGEKIDQVKSEIYS